MFNLLSERCVKTVWEMLMLFRGLSNYDVIIIIIILKVICLIRNPSCVCMFLTSLCTHAKELVDCKGAKSIMFATGVVMHKKLELRIFGVLL